MESESDRLFGQARELQQQMAARLQELVERQGLSRYALAAITGYDRTNFTRAINGSQVPSEAIADACDQALGTGREIAGLRARIVKVREQARRARAAERRQVPAPAEPDRQVRRKPARQRSARSLAYDVFRHDVRDGVAPRLDAADDVRPVDLDDEERLRRAAVRPSRVDRRVVVSLAAILAEQRAMEDLIGSSRLRVPVVAQLGELERFIGEAPSGVRRPLVEIGAQWAEFAGWLHISTGRWEEARVWLDRAAEWSCEVDAVTLHATTISFKGHLAFHLGQLGATVGLSRAASRDGRVWVGQRAYDAHQEARAHALAGERRAAVEALARGADLVAAAAEDSDDVPPWIYYYTPEFYALERGWVCRYLGRDDPAYNEEAIACLTHGLDGLGESRTSEWAAEFLCHLAAAYLQADSPDLAEAAGAEAATIVCATGSTRLLPRLRRLHADLAAYSPGNVAAADLGDILLLGPGNDEILGIGTADLA